MLKIFFGKFNLGKLNFVAKFNFRDPWTIIYPLISILFLLVLSFLTIKTIHLLMVNVNRISDIETMVPEKELVNFKIGEFETIKDRFLKK